MASPSRTREREEQRRLSLRTLVIASLASLIAAIVTSRVSTVGTPIAAAVTPVVVALVSELLHRPTEYLAQRVTRDTEALPEAAGAGPPPPPEADKLPDQAPAEPGAEPKAAEPAAGPGAPRTTPPVRVYRQRPSSPRRRKIAVGVVVATGALAFAIAAAALTIPELIGGGSITGDRDTTLFGGRERDEPEQREVTTPEEQPQEQTEPGATEPGTTEPDATEPGQDQTDRTDRTDQTDQTTTDGQQPSDQLSP
jgi:hypothetical protein